MRAPRVMILVLAMMGQMVLGRLAVSPWLVPDLLLVAMVSSLWRGSRRPAAVIAGAAAIAWLMTVQRPWLGAALYGGVGVLARWLATKWDAEDLVAQTSAVAALEGGLALGWCVAAGAVGFEAFALAAARVALTAACVPLAAKLRRTVAA